MQTGHARAAYTLHVCLRGQGTWNASGIDIPPCPPEPRDLGPVSSPLRASISSPAQLGHSARLTAPSSGDVDGVRNLATQGPPFQPLSPFSREEIEDPAEEMTCPMSSSQVPRVSILHDSILQVPLILKLAR